MGLIVYTPGSTGWLHFTNLSFHKRAEQGSCCDFNVCPASILYTLTVQSSPVQSIEFFFFPR